MSDKVRRFVCPNCFTAYEKDNSILMLTSGAAISGDGIRWSGDLENELHKIKRVKYCKNCRGPLDFHALLRGRLDEARWPPNLIALSFLAAFAAFVFGLEIQWWLAVPLAIAVAVATGMIAYRLDRLRLKRWRLTDADVKKLEK